MHHSLNEEGVSETLGLGRSSSRNRILLRWSIFGLSGLVLAALVVWYLSAGKDDGGAAYVTAPVERRDLVVRVTATGTLEPTNEVEVSSELSGMIRKVFVDHNDPVDVGQILAELDTDKLEAQVTRARATLTAAEARVKEAEAVLAEARRNFQRYSELARKKVVSEHELDVARATYKRALASLESVTADVQVAQADLDLRETDLKKACICSPISGVVLRRNVDPGQTVAAMLQAPVLFTLAEDLTAMELRVDVDEADISLVEEGQTASFTVDAYPDRTFPARITKVRLAPDTTEGVVTYETYLAVDNSELLLRPGMTATAEITVKTIQAALLVPNEALRFVPPAPETDEGRGLLRSILPHPPSRDSPPTNDLAGKGKRVWVVANGELKAVEVTTGLSDGQMTEVLAGGIEPGMEAVTDLRETE
jgi:HlyD family secretion protein